MTSQQTVPQDNANRPSPPPGLIDLPLIQSFQSKLREIIHTLPDETKESQWHRWELNRETGIYTAHILDHHRFPSGLIIQPNPAHLREINKEFAAADQDMPYWIYDDIGDPIQVNYWWLENQQARGKYLDVSGAAASLYSKFMITLAEQGRPDHVQATPENPEHADGTGSFLTNTA
jgi:hypothetical protein